MLEKFLTLYQTSPVIYTVFIFLLFVSFVIWSFSTLLLKKSTLNSSLADQVRELVHQQKFNEALNLCKINKGFFAKVLACAIASSQYGPLMNIKAIEAEAKRQRAKVWKSTELLKKIAWFSLLVGLLGSVLSSFYIFDEVNQAQKSLSSAISHIKLSCAPLALGIIIQLLGLFLYYHLQHQLHEFTKKIKEEALSLSEFLSHSKKV